MKWLWDRNISGKEVKEILKNPSSPKFIEYSALLLSRVNEPKIVFKYILPLDFCKNWKKIKSVMRKNRWNEPKIIYWDAIYRKVKEKLIERDILKKEKIFIKGDPFLEKIGSKIREIREEKKLTQRQLAEKIGISQQILSRIERGRENITIKNLRKIVSALGENLTLIFGNKKIEIK